MITHSQPNTRSWESTSLILCSFKLLLFVSLISGSLAAQEKNDIPALELGKPIERELAGDASHSYRIPLAANQFLHVVVEQKGIDVVVALFAPDGKKVAEVDSPNGTQGPEPLSLVPESNGTYRLVVRSLEKTAAVGRYEVKIEELRTATAKDKNRIAAQQVFMQAELLRGQQTTESQRSAIDKYQEALLLYRALADQRGEATTLGNIGLVYFGLGDKQKALDHFKQALPLLRAVGDRSAEATTLNDLGVVSSNLGEKLKALDYYVQALPLLRAVGDQSGAANTLTNMGIIYAGLGEKQKALDHFAEALPLRRAAGDRRGEATTLNNVGRAYADLGEPQKALDRFTQALLLNRAVRDRRGEAKTLDNIGRVYTELGEKQKALDYFAQALSLLRAIGDRDGEAATLNNIGQVYDDLAEKQKALDYLAQALGLFRASGERFAEGATLNNIGAVYADLGEPQKALDNYAQALSISRVIGNRRGEARTLNNIGRVYEALGQRQKALDYYSQALPLVRAVGDRFGEGSVLHNMGRIHYALGDKQKALEYNTQSLPLTRATGDREGEALALSGLAVLERDRGNLRGALTQIETVLAIIESLRTEIASQGLRASFFSTVQANYEFYIDLLMRLHKQEPTGKYDAAALQASERARARSLLELLAESNANIRQGVDPKLAERERALQQQLSDRAQRQIQLLGASGSEEQAQALGKEIDRLTTELQQVEAQIRQTSPRYAALTQPQPLTLKQIQTQVLDEDTILLEFSLGKDRSYLWAVTTTSITSYELPKRDEIETAARQVYALLTDAKQWQASPGAGRELTREKTETPSSPEAAMNLSRMVLAPVVAQLGNKRLLIVADGALQYIPFAALPVPVGNGSTHEVSTRRRGARRAERYEPLIVKHEIVNLPSASTIAVLRNEMKDRQPAEKTVAILADPVFESNDERVKQAKRTTATPTEKLAPAKPRELPLGMERAATDSGLKGGLMIPRLPFTRDEATQILSLVSQAESKGSLDFDASRQTAISGELSKYRYVHFATHGFLDSLHPELSGLVLSMVDEKGSAQDGFLRAHEIFNLRLPAELVVLSACQTGLGKEIRGEGLVSLTRGFMYAGAPRVVVSLWNVNDEATAELMTRFYRGMLKDKLRPAAALRAAQISLMKERKWQSPFYWAAFTVQGEWR